MSRTYQENSFGGDFVRFFPLAAWAVIAMLLLLFGCTSVAEGQSYEEWVPRSINTTPGVHIRSYDGQIHQDSVHYARLLRIVGQEYKIDTDSLWIMLTFISEEMRPILCELDGEYFGCTEWKALYIPPSSIFLSEETVGNFFHEVLHILYYQGKLFQNVAEMWLHPLIYRNERLLVASDGFLEYARELWDRQK